MPPDELGRGELPEVGRGRPPAADTSHLALGVQEGLGGLARVVGRGAREVDEPPGLAAVVEQQQSAGELGRMGRAGTGDEPLEDVVSASRGPTSGLDETDAVPVHIDLSTREGPIELIEQAVAELGGIDVLVDNVGVGDAADMTKGALLDLIDLPDSAWDHNFNLHFYSALRVSRAALPSLIERRGTIINVSSAGARLVTAGPVDYNVSKAALSALTKVIAEQLMSAMGASTGRLTTPEEVARLIAFAASPSNITGAEFLIDGGVIKSA